MTVHTAYLTIHHPDKTGFVHLTPQVEDAVRKSGVREGMVLVNPTPGWDTLGRRLA